jgi:hypothetical protein
VSSGFSQKILQNRIIQHRFRKQPLQLQILIFKLSQSARIRDFKPTKFGLQLLEGRRAQAVFATDIRRRHPSLLLLQKFRQTLRQNEGIFGGQVS